MVGNQCYSSTIGLNDSHQTDQSMLRRFRAAKKEAQSVRSSLYHLTNACNLRCKGCWFFSEGIDQKTSEVNNLLTLEDFVKREAERGINAPLIIGGEPTMFPERLEVYRKYMDKVAISTNGLRKLPIEGFEDLTIAISLFGGGELDDELRAIGPNGKRFQGLFDRCLQNYAGDPRAGFVYAISTEALPYMEDTIRKIQDHGMRVLLNYYVDFDESDPLRAESEARLLDEALRLKEEYPDTVASHPYFIRALITGRTEWGNFGYHSCPSISRDSSAHADRLANGNPVLSKFNAWSADLKTLAYCCTSGECGKCRDSQAISSWLLVNYRKFLRREGGLALWTEIAESYFSQFIWSAYHPANRFEQVLCSEQQA